MSHTPENSAISLNAKQEAHVATLASASEIAEYFKNLQVEQGLVTRDYFDPNILLETEKAGNARAQVTKTITVDNKAITLTAADEAGLLAQENALYRRAVTTQQTTQEQPRNDRGQFTTEEQATADAAREQEKTALALQFQLGQIDIATYLDKSGAVDDYLAKRGVDVEALADQTQARHDSSFQKSWSDAVDEFLHSPAGADWPGGENLQIATKLMTESNLVDSPSAETLANVWAHMKQHGLAVENHAVTAPKKINDLYDEAARTGTHPTSADILRAMGHNVSGVLGGR